MGFVFSKLWERFFGYKQFKICLVGLNNAGKTTILFRLHLGETVETHPTIGSNVEEVKHKNLLFQGIV
jgi:ADP-ribosylation factor-like protein 5B